MTSLNIHQISLARVGTVYFEVIFSQLDGPLCSIVNNTQSTDMETNLPDNHKLSNLAVYRLA